MIVSASDIVALLVIGTGAALAIYDIVQRRLPNWLVAVLLILSSVQAVLTLGWSGFALAATHGLVALAVGMALFQARIVGGGDAKFYAAVAIGVPWAKALHLVWWTSIGGLLVLLLLLSQILARRRQKEKNSFPVPFGVAIFVGLVGTTAF